MLRADQFVFSGIGTEREGILVEKWFVGHGVRLFYGTTGWGSKPFPERRNECMVNGGIRCFLAP
jgi:hypothetical protein